MFKRLFLVITVALPLLVAHANGQESVSENTKTRLDKQEIISQMLQAGRIPAQQQNAKLDSILQDQAASKTPRSDFMFCMGLAYMGNPKAQKCVGTAYEKGIGIVEDLPEAYTWYAVAAEKPIADKSLAQSIEEDRERVKLRLVSSYPSPSDDELEDQVNALKARIAQGQEDIKKAKNKN